MKRLVMAAMIVAAAIGAEALAPLQERKFDVSAGQTLEIDLETGGSIRITGADANVVVVKSIARGNNAGEFDLRVERTKNGVSIESEYEGSRRHWSGGVDLDITVPRRFNVELETTGGGITIQGVDGELEGSTMGGALDLKNVKGTVKMSTMGGGITLTDSEVDGELSTMGGRVVFRNVKGDVKGSSMGGDVVYDNVTRSNGATSNKPVEISTMGGDISVESAPAGANVSTMGGDIEIASAAGRVKAKTMGGTIEIQALDGGGVATTMGGDVEVRMVGDPSAGDRSVELESMGGDITLVVPDGLSMDVEIEISYTKHSARNFKISSDFSIAVSETPEWDYKGRSGGRKVISGKGTVAGGKNKIRISTVNGDVTLKKGK
ncbi:MAG: DUF4097 family beta strand repeat protein [Acidobacteria bacterium]|nr:DUF4097 family beta strand repeat protein [Acidobacteriota bacterium]